MTSIRTSAGSAAPPRLAPLAGWRRERDQNQISPVAEDESVTFFAAREEMDLCDEADARPTAMPPAADVWQGVYSACACSAHLSRGLLAPIFEPQRACTGGRARRGCIRVVFAIAFGLGVWLGTGCAESHTVEPDSAVPSTSDAATDAHTPDAGLDPDRVCRLKCIPDPACAPLGDDRTPRFEHCVAECLELHSIIAGLGCGDEMLRSWFCVATEPRVDCAASENCRDEGDLLRACLVTE